MATVTTQRPWYTFARIDNFGSIDPQGAYWKPDSNILTPPGYPVTALLDGQVTSTQRTAWGQTVVTIKLAQPLNSLATHCFYEHLHDSTVQKGQRVSAGALIGHANYSGEGAALGFGLYSGDIYGSGPAWSILQNDLRPGGAGLLNPVALLNAAAAGKLGTPLPTFGDGTPLPGGLTSTSSGDGSSFFTPEYATLLDEVHQVLIETPGFYGIALAIDLAEQFPGWIDLTQPQSVAGLNVPDVIGIIRSTGATITDNFLPVVVRGGLVTVGLILLISLLIRLAGAVR